MLGLGREFQEQILDQAYHFGNPGLGAINLVDYHHGGHVLLQRLAQHVSRLGHGAVHGIHQQQAAVGHVHHPFHLAAEISMARRVDDVDANAVEGNRGIFGQDRDAPLPLQRVGVHDQLTDLLVVAEHFALFQQRINQRCLAVIDVGYDGQIADIVVSVVTQSSSPHQL